MKQSRRTFLKNAGRGSTALSLSRYLSAGEATPLKPNIVFIFVDDLSWSDVGAYGSRYCETPNLDRFAQEGLRFTDGYCPAPICSASRAAVLTGRSPARLHFEFVSKAKGSAPPAAKRLIQPSYIQDLPLSAITLAEVLRPTGLTTGCVGKWHLTQQNNRYLGYGKTHGPAQQGFDYTAEDRGAHPYTYENREFGDLKPGEYPGDATTENAIHFMKMNRERPFVLYFSNYFPHRPVHTRCKWLYDKYREKATADMSEKRIMYGAFVETMDHYLGQFFQAMDDLGLADKTFVVFLSDNGGNPEDTSNLPLRGCKWTLYEGGVRVPFMVRWPGVVEPASTSDLPVMGTDLFPTFCELAGVQPDPTVPLDGLSLVPLLKGEREDLGRKSLYWHFPYYHPPEGYEGTTPCSAIRKGSFKLVHFYEDHRNELYDLAEDLGEQKDLSRDLHEKTRELQDNLFAYLQSVNARLPRLDPNYSG